MKAKVELEIEKEDLAHELTDLVKNTAKKDIEKLVKETAKPLVEEEVTRFIAPIAVKVLQGEELNFHNGEFGSWANYDQKRTAEDKIKSMLRAMLNQPSYKYSRTAGLTFDKYMSSSSGGERKSLIHHIIEDMMKEVFEETCVPIIKEAVEEIFKDMEGIKKLIKAQIEASVSSKISQINL